MKKTSGIKKLSEFIPQMKKMQKTCICVWSPNTHVLILLLDLVSRKILNLRNTLKFLTGNGAKYREIDVLESVQATGSHKWRGLIGLNHFAGADWSRKFVSVSKKTWANAYMKLEI